MDDTGGDAAGDDARGAGGVVAELRANPRLAAVELGSLAVALVLPVATLWALVAGPRPDAGVLAGVVVAGAGFASLWTLAYPAYDALSG